MTSSTENACLTDIINGADILRELADCYECCDRMEPVHGLRERLRELDRAVNELYFELRRREKEEED